MVSKSKIKKLEKKLIKEETSEFWGPENPKEILQEKLNKIAEKREGDPVDVSEKELQDIKNRLQERAKNGK